MVFRFRVASVGEMEASRLAPPLNPLPAKARGEGAVSIR